MKQTQKITVQPNHTASVLQDCLPALTGSFFRDAAPNAGEVDLEKHASFVTIRKCVDDVISTRTRNPGLMQRSNLQKPRIFTPGNAVVLKEPKQPTLKKPGLLFHQ